MDGELGRALAGRGWPARPLLGEPLSVDLLNTRWLTGSEPYDVLDDDELTRAWIAGHDLTPPMPSARAHLCLTREARAHLRLTRDAIAAAAADATSVGPLNAVLDQGRVGLHVGPDGPAERSDVPDPAWSAAWIAARDYVTVISRTPGRVRKCANPVCPLHFLDMSRTGERRWCSMAVCGNRSKARRHRSRTAAG